MKFIKSLIVMLALTAATAVQAQSYNQGTFPFASTFNIGTNATVSNLYVTNAVPTSMTKALDFSIMASFKLITAGTSVATFSFDESVDGITWTSATRTIAVTAAGTTLVGKSSNFTVGAMGFIRLSAIANQNADFMTNIVVKYAYKTP